jgi:hypothetical protein
METLALCHGKMDMKTHMKLYQGSQPVTYACNNPKSYNYTGLKTQLSAVQKTFTTCSSSNISKFNYLIIFFLIAIEVIILG